MIMRSANNIKLMDIDTHGQIGYHRVSVRFPRKSNQVLAD